MSQVLVTPEVLHTAAADLANIGLNVQAAHKVAALPTMAIAPAAADEVSAAIAQVFSQHASAFQGLAGHAAAAGDRFVANLHSGAFAYAATEAAGIGALVGELAPAVQNILSPVITDIEGLIGGIFVIAGFLLIVGIVLFLLSLDLSLGLLYSWNPTLATAFSQVLVTVFQGLITLGSILP